MLRVGVLGPLEVSVDGRLVVLTSGRLRSLVVVLAMAAGSPVPVDRLAAALWHSELPDHVRRAVQTYLGRLRGALGAGIVTTDLAGYRLAVDADGVDALRFGRLLEVAAGAGDRAGERAALDEALGLWRGEPFDGVPSEWLVRYEAPRLVEQRLGAIERCVDLDLAEGRHGEVVAWLQELTARYPLRESLWVRLLVALDRSGRQAEALARYEEVRRRIAEELGTDPGPALRQLHADLLSAKSPRPVGLVPAGRGRRVVPHQLPRDLAGFAGRVGALARLDGLLGAGGDGVSTSAVVTVITGMAGVGKTTLAVHWAHRVADRFPDGQLYVNLRGFHPSGQVMTAREAVRGLLAVLDVPPERVPAELDAQVGLYRSLLAGRRVLVLLDNARDAEQVRPLLPASPSCLVLVTSRHQLTSLVATDGARPLPVDLLTDEEAGELLAHRLGAGRVAAEPVAVAQIIQRCAGLPLALAVAAAHAATRPAFALSVMAERLGDERTRLDVLTAGDPGSDARAVFSWSYHELSPAAAGLFRLLGLHCGPDLSVAAAASLAGRPVGELRPVLAELCGQHLLIEHAPGRFVFHDLLRAYAAELAGRYDSEQVRREARHRLLDHYVHTGAAAARLLNPHREPITIAPPQPGVAPERLIDDHQAHRWLATEYPVLLAAVRCAEANGFDAHAWRLAWSILDFMHRRGYWHDWQQTQLAALAAAQRLGDQSAQASAHRHLALAYSQLDQYDLARSHFQAALGLYGQLGDQLGLAHTHLNLSNLGRAGHYQEALHHCRQALDLYVAIDNRLGQARTLSSMGAWLVGAGEFAAALDYCERAGALFRALADHLGEGCTWDTIGMANHGLGRHREAIGCYQRALAMFALSDSRFLQADTLAKLGEAHLAAGEPQAARTAWQRALAIFDESGHPEAEAIRVMLKKTHS